MGYFVEDFDVTDVRSVLRWSRDDHDPFDQWGWAMSWLFDLCAEIESRGECAPPECGYQPGVFGPEVSEDRAEGLAEFPLGPLVYAARVFNRFADCLKRADQSY